MCVAFNSLWKEQTRIFQVSSFTPEKCHSKFIIFQISPLWFTRKLHTTAATCFFISGVEVLGVATVPCVPCPQGLGFTSGLDLDLQPHRSVSCWTLLRLENDTELNGIIGTDFHNHILFAGNQNPARDTCQSSSWQFRFAWNSHGEGVARGIPPLHDSPLGVTQNRNLHLFPPLGDTE